MEILGFLICDQPRDEIAEIDFAGWQRYQLAQYATNYLIEFGKTGKFADAAEASTPQMRRPVQWHAVCDQT